MLSLRQACEKIRKEFPNEPFENIFDWYHSYGFSLSYEGDMVDDYRFMNKETGDIRILTYEEYSEELTKLDNDNSILHDEEGAIIKKYKVSDVLK